MTSSSNGCTGISNIGSLAINGTILVSPTKTNTLQVGDSIRLWTDVANVSGTPKVESVEGLEWDDSRLISEGLLIVKSISTSIIIPSNASTSSHNIYDLRGRLVRKDATSTDGLKPGIYVIEGKKWVVR